MRAVWARHPRVVDVLVVLVCALWSFDSGNGIVIPQAVDGVWLAANLVASATMLVRRTRPWVVVLVVVAGGAVAPGHFIGVALFFALYALAAYRSTRDALLGSALAMVVLVAAAGRTGDQAILFLVIAVLAVLAGANARIRRKYVQALLDRTDRLVREKELAAARERTRIAHDLHDIVAHSLTVMVRLADGAAAVAGSDPARARAASERVAGVGRDAMTDMRRLLLVLRDDGPGTEQSAQDLEDLVATFRAAGLPVDIRRHGSEPAALSFRNAIFRTVQESLTNALRYAEDVRTVMVDLDYRGDPIVIEVTDDGRGGGTAPSAGAGQGLNALRERLSLYGGTVQAGPRSPHGWTVRVELPRPGEDARG
ncbi:sensor histidine kinase [Actinoplanes sp. NPDC049265]|uniref:sensor histidine kinase n=1 Tax=Actinoplanes sp. NPDC049265 TaxID=3363902 RepID=UPI0037147159